MHSEVVVRIVDDLTGTHYRWMFPSADLDSKFLIDRHGAGPALKPYWHMSWRIFDATIFC